MGIKRLLFIPLVILLIGNVSAEEKAIQLPPVGKGFSLVIEAESGDIAAPLKIEDFAPRNHPQAGPQNASGGKCILVPEEVKKDKSKPPTGSVKLVFKVPADGTYYIHPRVFWQHGCGNSINMIMNDAEPVAIRDANYQVWHWITLVTGPKLDKVKGFALKAGENTLIFANREPGVRLDQVFITDDPEKRPAGIMKNKE